MTTLDELDQIIFEEAVVPGMRMILEDMRELERIGFYDPIPDDWTVTHKFSTGRM